jgi:hypothetical protein
MMKRNLLLLFSAAITAAFAQPTFKLTPSNSTRLSSSVVASGNGRYILKETSVDPMKTKTGKFYLRDAENKTLVTKDYQVPLKYNTIPINEMIRQGDKLFSVMAAANGSNYSTRYRVFTQRQVVDLQVQERDYTTLLPKGTPKLIKLPSDMTLFYTLIHSQDGKRSVLMRSVAKSVNKLNYRLFDEDFNEIASKDIEVPLVKTKYDLNEPQYVMNNRGDIAFVTGSYDNIQNNVVFISAATQKVISKQIVVKGKLVCHTQTLDFDKDGGLVVASTYGPVGKKLEYMEGVVVVKYSADNMEVVWQTEIPFTSQVVEKCKEAHGANGKALFYQITQKIHFTEDGGYVIATGQDWKINVNANYMSNVTNNLIAVGLGAKGEAMYQNVVRAIDKSSKFILLKGAGTYVSGDMVYYFHASEKDNVKNTPDEFDMYCTYWQHGKTEPKTIEVNRPYTDLHLFPGGLVELDKNKILFQGQGKGGDVFTTMEIENK